MFFMKYKEGDERDLTELNWSRNGLYVSSYSLLGPFARSFPADVDLMANKTPIMIDCDSQRHSSLFFFYLLLRPRRNLNNIPTSLIVHCSIRARSKYSLSCLAMDSHSLSLCTSRTRLGSLVSAQSLRLSPSTLACVWNGLRLLRHNDTDFFWLTWPQLISKKGLYVLPLAGVKHRYFF